ncbi:hypothetical protein Back11_53840 [Paenibacillus baekrokdamisoli]|uniref:Uncharacterized protein n=1 Tax=Paenibacillus baekrokdamisoli TaxID=1712516 RepID=A0A3G9JLY6_9BACL|nr:hypothetical protein [Paenibacillus baekrokdamisoli]MBB3073409.1 ferric iron reductase protein FhuF [Paenibacillus baekrokdamisoli]BBH24039.1 hypothetical protein Back11_53840 [Paenibacillus baekrokdamisoli]
MNQATLNRTELLQKECSILFRSVDDEVIQEYTFDALLEPANALGFLQFYAAAIKADELSPAATYFASNLHGIIMAVQRLMSTDNAVMNWSLSNWSLVLVAKDGYTSLMFRPVDSVIEDIAPINREEWRNKVLARFYGGTLKPLIQVIASEAGLNVSQLWALVASSLYYYKEQAVTLYDEKSIVYEQVISDYHYLVNEMDGSVFERNRNPLQVKIQLVDNPYRQGEQMPLRFSCCLAYLTECRSYCYSCPKLSKEERSKMAKAIIAAKVGAS